MNDHKDIMEKGTEESKQAWMKRFHEEWEAAEDV